MAIRLRIEVPLTPPTVFKTQDSVHNLLVHAMAQHGYHLPRNQPARWGFGVIRRPVSSIPTSLPLFHLQRIIVGSTDREIADVLAQLTPDDLTELSQVPGSGLDLRHAQIIHDRSWIPTAVLPIAPISPVRVLEHGPRGSIALLQLGPTWEARLNHVMTRRFDRPFAIRVIPDDIYLRERGGRVCTQLPVKSMPKTHRPVVLPGLQFPAILTGPEADLRDAWFNGLGAGTGMGFGCLGTAG